MLDQVKSPRFLVLSLLVIAAAATRALPLFIPHIWNFSAVYALAIFAGAQFNNRILALAMPLAAMTLSDLFIGNGFSRVVYSGFIIIVICGMAVRNHKTVTNIALASITGTILFYLITNFSFFYSEALYNRSYKLLIKDLKHAVHPIGHIHF